MRICRSEAFDLILSDVNMPGVGGHDLARWLATEFPRCRVGLMSSLAAECETCPFWGGCPLLPKPFSVPQLRQFVSAILGQPRPKIDWDWNSKS